MGQYVPKLYWEQGIIELMIGAFKSWVGFVAKPKVESESSVNSVIIPSKSDLKSSLLL